MPKTCKTPYLVRQQLPSCSTQSVRHSLVIAFCHKQLTRYRYVAAALAFITLLTSLFILRRGSNGTSRLPSLITTAVGSLAAVLTTVVFLIDVILVAVVRHRVSDATDGKAQLTWGNGVRVPFSHPLFCAMYAHYPFCFPGMDGLGCGYRTLAFDGRSLLWYRCMWSKPVRHFLFPRAFWADFYF